jgi:hypothetical protein
MLTKVFVDEEKTVVVNFVLCNVVDNATFALKASAKVVTEVVTKVVLENVWLRRFAMTKDDGEQTTKTVTEVRQGRFLKALSPFVVIGE